MSLRCVLLMGGNAAGKTTTFEAARRRNRTSGVKWVEADYDLAVPIAEQDATIRGWWEDADIDCLVLCGMRIYSAVFRVALASRVSRHLFAGLFYQDPLEGRLMIRARCRKRNKEYNAWFWEDPSCDQLFGQRYERGWGKFLRDGGTKLPVHLTRFDVDRSYRALPYARHWLHNAVSGALAPWTDLVAPPPVQTSPRRFPADLKRQTLRTANSILTPEALGAFCRRDGLEWALLRSWAKAFPDIEPQNALKRICDR